MNDDLGECVERNVERLVHAAECELPALEGIVVQAEARFGGVFADDTARRRFGKVSAEALWSPRRRPSRRVALRVVRGLTNVEVASLLGCSSNTVRNVLATVFHRVRVSTRSELTFLALQERISNSKVSAFDLFERRIDSAVSGSARS